MKQLERKGTFLCVSFGSLATPSRYTILLMTIAQILWLNAIFEQLMLQLVRHLT